MKQIQPRRPWPVASAMLALVAMTVFAAGCAIPQAPRATVQDVMPGERSAEAVRVEFLVNLENPNPAPIELHELDYRLTIDSGTVYRGRRAAQVTLPAFGSTQVVVPAVIGPEALAELERPEPRYSLSGSLRYVRPGQFSDVLRDLGLPRPRARFRHTSERLAVTQ